MTDVTTSTGKQLLPNQRGQILLLGLAAWLIGIVGLIALGKGFDHLKQIKDGKMDPTGRGMVVLGMILGVAGLVVNLSLLIHQCARS